MALKFRLKGLAETFIEEIHCPECGSSGKDDQYFSTELTKVTLEGIVVVVQCRGCGEIFVPVSQRLGILDPEALRLAVEKDIEETGEPPLSDVSAVRLNVERLNADRKNSLH
jgi:uncharacterized Zn finger protein